MSEADRLNAECAVFCRYLLGRPPGEYIAAKYRDYHRRATATTGGFERSLLNLAAVHPFLTLLADSYARLFLKRGLLRKKLILLLALLESASPHADEIDDVPSRGPLRNWVGLAASVAASVLAVLASMAAFAAWHALSNALDRLPARSRLAKAVPEAARL